MDLSDRAIRRFRRRLAALLVVKYVLPPATAWLFAWGVAVLALRAAAGVARLPLLWGLAGLAVCLSAAVVWARKRLPSDAVVRALFDRQAGCGGLLMAGAEQDLGGWRERLPALSPPRLHWDGRRPALLLALAVGFLALTFLAPQGLADLGSRSPLEVDQEVLRLAAQITLLRDESVLDPGRAESLKEKLASLREHASGKDPARTLEALDHLRQLTRETAREAAESRARRSERLGEAEALADALRQNADLFGPQLKAETLVELVGLLEKSGLDLKRLAAGLDPQMLNALREQKVDPEQMRKLAEAIRVDRAELARQVEKLHRAGLIDSDLPSPRPDGGASEAEGLRQFLREKKGAVSLAEIKKHLPTAGPGPRGRAEVLPTWARQPSSQAGKFRSEVLPPADVRSLSGGRSGVPAERPGRAVASDKPAEPAASGALHGARAGGGSANSEALLPRHRAAVEHYFERKSEIRNTKSERNDK